MKHYIIFGETPSKKDFKIIVPKKKELYFFLALYLVKHIWKRISLKKDFKIIVPKKKELYFFLALYLVKHF